MNSTTSDARKPLIGVTCSTMDEKEGHGVRRLQVPEPYVRCVEAADGLPILLPVADPSKASEYLALVDGLLLIGGDDVDPALYHEAPHPELGPVDPARDVFEIALTQAAVKSGLPTLGVCRGVQVINVALGGTLHQHIPDTVPGALSHGEGYDEAHEVSVTSGSRLATVLGAERLSVNSHHHQAIDRPGRDVVVTARAPDGVIEGAEVPGHPFLLGVQWHPERMATESTRRLFRAFVEASHAARGTRPAR